MEPIREGNQALRAMVLVVVFAAVGVSTASLTQSPTYEASAHVLVGWQQEGRLETLEHWEPLSQTMTSAIDSRPVAEETIQRLQLEMTPTELLDNLTVEQVETAQFIRLTYEDTDPVRAQRIVNTVGEVFSEFISDRSSEFTATVWEKAMIPTTPASPHPLRNGLLTLVVGLVLSSGLALRLPRSLRLRVEGNFALGRAVRQGVRRARLSGGRHDGPSQAERSKEKELLWALDRSGKLTALGAALETSLTVGQSERMLQALADKGHLEVTVEHGRLHYALWRRDAPL